MRWQGREAAARFAERRRREDAAPRLLATVPKLMGLRLDLRELRASDLLRMSSHVRPVVVANAPALFVFPCQDPSCQNGGHDVTLAITDALLAGKTHLEGEDACYGQTGSAGCGRVLRYLVTATYSA